MTVVGFEPPIFWLQVQRSNHQATAAAESTENLWYLSTVLINVYVASPDPDPTPRGGGQLPNPKSAILC